MSREIMGRRDSYVEKRLVGKTIESVELSGSEVYLYFTDGSRFEYDASDGGYSTYNLYEKGDE